MKVREGLIDQMKKSMKLATDSQLAVVLDETVEGVEKLRAGEPVSWATALRIAALRGLEFDAKEIVEPIA